VAEAVKAEKLGDELSSKVSNVTGKVATAVNRELSGESL
jgi:hypothetical protein